VEATLEITVDPFAPSSGLVYVDAPQAQGVTGFLSRRDSHHLTDMELSCGNEYATVLVVSLDAEPIARSRQLLIQVGTTARPSGWRERPTRVGKDEHATEGFEIVDHGTAPWLVEDVDAVLTLRNSNVTEAVKLDPNGYAVKFRPVETLEDGIRIRLPRNAKYTILR